MNAIPCFVERIYLDGKIVSGNINMHPVPLPVIVGQRVALEFCVMEDIPPVYRDWLTQYNWLVMGVTLAYGPTGYCYCIVVEGHLKRKTINNN